ncbi:MAG: hypothetical protein RBU37_02515 [Myxococcota bacterium]|jgi:serine/threonine protein kinase|nr:hypothetical protein [Myxococcota bacterium]
MNLALGQCLTDQAIGEARFCPTRLLAEGARCRIYEAEDTHLDRKLVCLKVPRHGPSASSEQIQANRERLSRELRTLTLGSPLIPEPLDWLSVHNPSLAGALAKHETILVYEQQAGRALDQKILDAPNGIEPLHALGLCRELLLLARVAHQHELVIAGLRPEHIILGIDDTMHLVGWGNACAIGSRADVDPSPYAAPELAQQAATPSADLYSMGLLLYLLLTGQAPNDGSWPFDNARLEAMPSGLAHLIGRLAHPDPSQRAQSVEEVLPLLRPGQLPPPGPLPQPSQRDKMGEQVKRPIDKKLGEQAERPINKKFGEQAERPIDNTLAIPGGKPQKTLQNQDSSEQERGAIAVPTDNAASTNTAPATNLDQAQGNAALAQQRWRNAAIIVSVGAVLSLIALLVLLLL